MSASVFGAAAAVTMLNRAFNNASPANAVFNNQVATAGSTDASQFAFATTFAQGFASMSNADLASRVMGNLGMLPNDALLAAFTDYLGANGVGSRGVIVLQLSQILSTMENATGDLAIYAPQAVAWNTEVEKSFIYSSSASSTTTYNGDFPDTPVNVGQTFTLTTGVDNITGTGGNDTLIADNTMAAPKQLSAADQINGGGGTDLIKIFLAAADTATGQPTMTSVEQVYINGGAIIAYTAATGTTLLSIDAASANVAATYTLSGQDLTLANKTSTAATTTTVAAGATSTHTAQKITLNAITRDAAANATTIDISGTKVATLNLETTGAASNIALTNTGTAVKTLNITGDKGLTVSAAPAGITTVNAADATGAVSYAAGTPGATFKFTGGSANDTVSFADNGLAALTSGAQLVGGEGTGDKIAIFDTTLTATEIGRINQATGFEVLGLNASVTVDASTLTSIKSFAVDTAATTSVINSMATGTTTAINASTTSLTLGTAVGVIDTAVTIGGATGGVTATTLVTTGISNVSIASNGAAANVVTTLTNSDNSLFTITGAAGLTLALSAGTAVGSKIDGSAATGVLNLTGSGVVGSGDIIVGGSGADVINGRAGADTLTGGAGADTFSFTVAAAANASGAAFGQADVITDFVVGTDKLQFSTADVVSAEQVAVQAAVTALAAGSTAGQIAAAMAGANNTNLGVSVATFGGNTYVLYQTTAGGAGVAADDAFIQLTGVASGVTFANSVIA